MSEDKKYPICNRCQKEITVPAYVKIWPSIVLQELFEPMPAIFKTPEHAENFSKGMIFHTDCWMDELRDHGIKLHDIKKIIDNLIKKQNKDK